ncbi:metal-dependent hydrolase [Clostridium tyrobutyricum]|uniref:metal-dependent hydrolase n=1 Tax=Clostridium tyrobutyricum TaxID=1519 RepID=UPI0011CC6979|nr:metal-dependent hydrolase [Clostridium tyrobutyricum]
MLKKTHIATSLATVSVINYVFNIPPINVSILVGALIGGLMPDVDLQNSTISKLINKIIISIIILLLLFLCISKFLGLQDLKLLLVYKYQRYTTGSLIILLSALFSRITGHRMFSHSFLGLAAFSFGISILYKPIFLGFLIGYLSHLVIDILNYKGEALIFPFKKYYSLKICSSSGIVNQFMFFVSLSIFCILIIQHF